MANVNPRLSLVVFEPASNDLDFFLTIIVAFDVHKRNSAALIACLMAFESVVLVLFQ